MTIRLHQARKSAGLSLRALADQVGVSAMALSKYERGLINPSPDVERAIAEALSVPIEFLRGEATEALSQVEYRATGRMTPISKSRIHKDISAQMTHRLEAEVLLPELAQPRFSLPRLPARIKDLADIEAIARRIRDHWDLGQQPILNLTNLVEAMGIRTFVTTVEDGYFDGLSAQFGEDPIAVTGIGWPGDRQRFTLAHEVGHIVLHSRMPGGVDEEAACHRFAGAFIAPDETFKAAVGRASINPLTLYTLKHEFGLSMSACLYRCQHLGLVSQARARRLWRQFRNAGWLQQEPGAPISREMPTRFLRTVISCWLEERISDELATTILQSHKDSLTTLSELIGMHEGDAP